MRIMPKHKNMYYILLHVLKYNKTLLNLNHIKKTVVDNNTCYLLIHILHFETDLQAGFLSNN